MCNNFVAVGRMIKDLVVTDNMTLLTISVSKPYKNDKGEYENDILEIILKGHIAEKTKEYCELGMIVGVRGYIESHNILVADKITFLSHSQKDTETGQNEEKEQR